MRTCPNCGCRVYRLGCVNCDEGAYIDEQIALTELQHPGVGSATVDAERQCGACPKPESEHTTAKALAAPGHFFQRRDRRAEAR